MTYDSFCPICEDVLLTDMPGQMDVDGFCANCMLTFNIDFCAGTLPGVNEPLLLEFVPAYPGYAERMKAELERSSDA